METMETQDDYIATLVRRIDEVSEENKQLRSILTTSVTNISKLEHVVRALTLSHAQMASDMQIIYESVKSIEGAAVSAGINMDLDDDDGTGGSGGMLN